MIAHTNLHLSLPAVSISFQTVRRKWQSQEQPANTNAAVWKRARH